jgi:2-polyprenyl-3-methyl-5-hydroxy-6-metoxy-1,4-benzoquinol methylase
MISIIICSINSEKFNSITKNYTELMGGEPFEIIGIHDAKSLCEGYNRGIQKSVGDILVFSHDDIEILSPDFVARLKAHLENFDIVGLAGTDWVVDGNWLSAGFPYLYGQVADRNEDMYALSCYDFGETAHEGKTAEDGIKMLDGLFIAARRSVAQKILFDEKNFDGFHCYDADFTYSAFLAGFNLAVCNDIAVIHYSNSAFDAEFQRYNERFIEKHATTLDAPEEQESYPSFQVARCANKERVLHCFSPEVQRAIYAQFTASLPVRAATSVSVASSSEIKQTPIHHQHNPELLSEMPLNAKRVIEVGCSSGALAKAYRELNPSCEYIGTEIDSDYAAVARQHCQKVIVGNIEQMLDEIHATQGAFDCWVFGDVLEHLYDPWRVLRRIAKDLLNPGGSVVVCIPNVQYWRMQLAVNMGDFRYQDSGMMDRTHIRWFSRVTIIEMFEQAGLQVASVGGRILDEPHREQFMPLLHALAQATGVDADQAVEDAVPMQWVVRATL